LSDDGQCEFARIEEDGASGRRFGQPEMSQ
jgi:hypothetical protein